MKYTIRICDCCGKEFYSDYWAGGYIDHVVNFSNRRYAYSDKTPRDIARNIIFSGNNLRSIEDIVIRLDCFMTWRTVSDETKTEVKRIVDEMVTQLWDALNNAREIAKNTPLMVLAMLREDDLDDSFWEAFNSIVGEEVEE